MTTNATGYDVKALGQWVRREREAYGLTQQELANYLGLNQKKISRIEKGEIADPGFYDIASIAWWFGVSLNRVVANAGILDPNGDLARRKGG